MDMETIEVPSSVPVMTLPHVVFFPQALLPLHIFEPRYQEMLRDVLATTRIFAVARMDPKKARRAGANEPSNKIATVGIIRACQESDNGTSNLLLQGLTRVEIGRIIRERPYRIITGKPLASVAGSNPSELEDMRGEVMRLINVRRRLGAPAPKGMTQFLDSIEDFDAFADVAAFNLCDDDNVKQRLLEELDTSRRLRMFVAQLKGEIEAQRLRRKLQGPVTDDHIADN